MKKLPRLLSQRKKNAEILTDLLKNEDIILPSSEKMKLQTGICILLL